MVVLETFQMDLIEPITVQFAVSLAPQQKDQQRVQMPEASFAQVSLVPADLTRPNSIDCIDIMVAERIDSFIFKILTRNRKNFNQSHSLLLLFLSFLYQPFILWNSQFSRD